MKITLQDMYTKAGHPRVDGVNLAYLLLGQRPASANISHATMPSAREHTKFVKSRPYAEWLLVRRGRTYIGQVTLTWRNEIGIAILSWHQGKGYGKAALEVFLRKVKPLPAVPSQRPAHFVANINPLNERSVNLFTQAGFHKLQVTYALKRRNDDGKDQR